ncbi:MAG: matrixin family metalloprotease [Oligoflexia bacterium]|nr:matrixin family metalloprotease [Oligoflexia bacterium]
MKALILGIMFSSFYSMPGLAFTLCTTNPGQSGWNTKTITFKVNYTNCPANIGSIIDSAMSVWNSVTTSSLVLKREGTSTDTAAQLALGNQTDSAVIACDSNFGTTFSTDANAVAGVGVCRTQGGVITRGYLIFNTQAGASANISSLNSNFQSVITAHELGHVIGLGHSTESAALMYYDASSKTVAGLNQDDIDGITYLYPRNEIGGDGFFGCGSVSNKSKSGTGGNFPMQLAVLTIPIIGFIILRRKTVLTLST